MFSRQDLSACGHAQADAKLVKKYFLLVSPNLGVLCLSAARLLLRGQAPLRETWSSRSFPDSVFQIL
jgi:hypothetical protein